MGIKDKIMKFIARNNDASKILKLMMKQKYVTVADIINFECENTPLVFTACPHKIIEILRKELGYDVVQDETMKYEKVIYREGKPMKTTKHYKRYFLNLEGEGV